MVRGQSSRGPGAQFLREPLKRGRRIRGLRPLAASRRSARNSHWRLSPRVSPALAGIEAASARPCRTAWRRRPLRRRPGFQAMARLSRRIRNRCRRFTSHRGTRACSQKRRTRRRRKATWQSPSGSNQKPIRPPAIRTRTLPADLSNELRFQESIGRPNRATPPTGPPLQAHPRGRVSGPFAKPRCQARPGRPRRRPAGR
jgi:hypothetical protein